VKFSIDAEVYASGKPLNTQHNSPFFQRVTDFGSVKRQCFASAFAQPWSKASAPNKSGTIALSPSAGDADLYPNLYQPIIELVRTSLTIVGALFPIVISPENVSIFLTLTARIRHRKSKYTRAQNRDQRIHASFRFCFDWDAYSVLLRDLAPSGAGWRRSCLRGAGMEFPETCRRRLRPPLKGPDGKDDGF
jgi:hypothetical protein